MGNFSQKVDKFIEIFLDQNGYVKVLQGLQNTLMIAICGLIIGIVIGTLIATVRVIPKYKTLPKVLNHICSFYCGTLQRNTYGSTATGILLCIASDHWSKNYRCAGRNGCIWSEQRSLYFRDRAKWYSVSRSGTDGGRTCVGLSFGTSMTKIVIPQAVKNILPTLGNEFISLVKETSVVSFVGAADLYVAFNYIGK